jgi:predicted transcriptional regulator of viral defense system
MAKKTLGSVSSNLILTLYEKGTLIFSANDVRNITGFKENYLYRFIQQLVDREVILRLKPGKYFIIPQEIGRESRFIGNWYVVAREIANSPLYYISFYSAMDLHNMTAHPLVKIYITTPKQERKKIRTIVNVKFEFIVQKKEKIWGIQELWINNTEKIRVSDLERTILDCLFKPKYSGGILEIAKGIWIQRDKIDYEKLLDYTQKLNVNVVAKRLGFLFEVFQIGYNLREKLRKFVNNKYYLLDPTIPKSETFKNNWKLIANINPEELSKAVQT